MEFELLHLLAFSVLKRIAHSEDEALRESHTMLKTTCFITQCTPFFFYNDKKLRLKKLAPRVGANTEKFGKVVYLLLIFFGNRFIQV